MNSDGQFNLSGTAVLMNITNIDVSNSATGEFEQTGGTLVVGVDGGLNTATAVRAVTIINGDFTQSAGTIKIDIFGADGVYDDGEVGNFPAIVQTDSDLLDVDGVLHLAGTLDINTNGVQPPAFGWYDVADADLIIIDTSTFNLTGVGLYQVIDNPNGGKVLQVAAPEPVAILAWLLASVMGFGAWRRFARRKE